MEFKKAPSSAPAEILDSLPDAPVLVIGDLMLDRFVYGAVERISPESPVPVLAIRREENMLGGAGNALANLLGLKAKGFLIGVIGQDAAGATIRDYLETLGADSVGLVTDTARPTSVKTRFLAGHQQLLRTDFEESLPVSDAVAAQMIALACKKMPAVKAVILSDYGKGVLRPDVIAAVIEAARAQKIPVIVDPKGRDYARYRGASAVTPNKKELAEAAGAAHVTTDAEIIAAAQGVMERCDIGAVIATRSKDGLSLIQNGAEPLHVRGQDIEVFDVSGAGDTVIATVAAALAGGADLAAAATLANSAGSIAVTKVGTAPIRLEELREALQEDSTSRRSQAALATADQALETVRRWRARGLTVGLTNGCFDVLHVGHVSYLNEARRHCDRLIVALNRDSSVKILKGPERPVHDEAARAAVLGALGAVDMVVLFGAAKAGEDNTATGLISVLQPDVYFKGGDYTADQIPEAPAVRAYGGRIALMPVYEGHSSTGSIQKMKNKVA